MAIVYHAGQIAVQNEANSRPAADMLAERLGGRSPRNLDFYANADLFVFATVAGDSSLRFGALSGAAPLVRAVDGGVILPPDLVFDGNPVQIGAIAINLEQRKRARINGPLIREGERLVVRANEEIVNCRKYIAPSIALEAGLHAGPEAREPVAIDDARLADVVARGETAFLASVSPSGQPDVSHRGGPLGFISLDAGAGRLMWPELIGNGMFKSTGNVRATGTASLLVLDLEAGDAYELSGRAAYRTVLRYDAPRDKGLWPHSEDFPTQGEMTLEIAQATLLRRLILPRQRVLGAAKITSCSPAEDQVPR
ncbi:MAG TPA: pyridoxamine 5'-phosphate oxidase family protein [Dehalococcoidia bacterium]|nr:pyridoxamine 5'-phosphate oxidase family protein [Dehalococcoidia bacterium]